MELYTAETIQSLDLAGKDPRKTFLTSLVKEGLHNTIGNIKAEVALLKADRHLLPILVPNGKRGNSYVCSPHTHYITVGIESLGTLMNPAIRFLAAGALRTLGFALNSASINKVIYVNHWLLSTDLHPASLTQHQIDEITATLIKRYPDRAILFRSLNSWTNSRLMRHLDKTGYHFVASRHTYISSMEDETVFSNRIVKNDLKLWQEACCEVADAEALTDVDAKRIAHLCRILAIDHHSSWNPRVDANFIEMVKKHPAYTLKAIKKEGVIIGAIGYQINEEGVLTCTLFGYDKNHPDQTDHYRLVSTLLLLEAKKHAKTFNQSAGGSYFKKSRGARGYTEYQAVYTKHLSRRQNAGWSLLKKIINRFAPDMMREY